MIVLRSLVFTVFLYGSIAVAGILFTPLLFGPRRLASKAVGAWAKVALQGARIICGITVEVRGREHMPQGAALVAAKHQGMLDVIAPWAFLDDPCFVLKKELMPLPFFGWFAIKTHMIPVDRAAHSSALKKLVRDTRDRLDREARQVMIFPEGTRTAPGAEPDYKPGVAALYRDLDTPCFLIATNSGDVWPAHGFIRRPGVAVFEFLEPIPAGMKRGPFMELMIERIETASGRLHAEAQGPRT